MIQSEAAIYRRGAILVAASTVVLSSAGFLARWAQTAPATTLFWRSVFATLSLLIYLALTGREGLRRNFGRLGRHGLGMAACFAASMICFITALSYTSVAAVLFFQAAAPLCAATLAWLFLHERIGRVQMAAIAVTFAGVLVMVAGQPAGGLVGAVISAVMTLTFAGSIVLARVRRDIPATAAVCVAVAIVAVVTAPFAELAVTWRELGQLALFGTVQMGLGLVLFTAGVVLIPAADAGLISILETVLAPVWVWLAFGEDPGTSTLVGGVIVLAAVAAVARWGRPDSTASSRPPVL